MGAGKPHLVLVGPIAPWRGGIAQYNTQLYEALQRRARVEFYSYSRQYPRFLYPGASDREPGSQAPVEGVHYTLDSLNPLTWLALFRKLDRQRPDSLVLTWSVPFWAPHLLLLGMLVRLFTGIRIFFVSHNVVSHDAGAMARICSQLVLRLGHGHLVHSQSELAKLARQAPAAPRVLAKMPPLFEPPVNSPTREAARRVLGIDEHTRLLLFYGFVRPYKGLPMALDALARTSTRPQLIVAGEIWRGRSEIDAKVEGNRLSDLVRLIDRYATPEETARYFAACDAVLLPYRTATGSGILPIAYLFERPVIATSVGSLTDCVEPGRTGVLVEPNVEALAEGIDAFFRAFDRSAAPAAIREYLAQEISWERPHN